MINDPNSSSSLNGIRQDSYRTAVRLNQQNEPEHLGEITIFDPFDFSIIKLQLSCMIWIKCTFHSTLKCLCFDVKVCFILFYVSNKMFAV